MAPFTSSVVLLPSESSSLFSTEPTTHQQQGDEVGDGTQPRTTQSGILPDKGAEAVELPIHWTFTDLYMQFFSVLGSVFAQEGLSITGDAQNITVAPGKLSAGVSSVRYNSYLDHN